MNTAKPWHSAGEDGFGVQHAEDQCPFWNKKPRLTDDRLNEKRRSSAVTSASVSAHKRGGSRVGRIVGSKRAREPGFSPQRPISAPRFSAFGLAMLWITPGQ